MRGNFTFRSRILVGMLAMTLGLLLAAAAFAVLPTAGRTYAGHDSAAKINGFRAPVSFTVSSSGTSLAAFQYGNVGCIASPITGNPYAKSTGMIAVGTIAVASTGSFSIVNDNSRTGIKSTISGKFKTATTATGKITFRQHITGPGGFNKSCGPIALTFKATTK